MDTLEKYISAFQKLRIDKAHGYAPHKPILLLSVLQAFQNHQIHDKRIFITPELVALFKSYWSLLVISQKFDCCFSLPFYHLKNDRFWKLIPKPGFENILQFKASMRSFTNLNAAVEYALIEEDLCWLMKEKTNNNILKQLLLDTYFTETKNNSRYTDGEQRNIFDDIEGKILKEDAEQYRNEIKKLMQQHNEEEIYLRGSVFKREIPKRYNNTCCISGMKIDATISLSMIDACHIIPFSESYDDTITNGIALCPNLHRAFDRGLIGIDENYKVVVSKVFTESSTNYSIRHFEGQKINLPLNQKYYPFIENLHKHMTKIFKS